MSNTHGGPVDDYQLELYLNGVRFVERKTKRRIPDSGIVIKHLRIMGDKFVIQTIKKTNDNRTITLVNAWMEREDRSVKILSRHDVDEFDEVWAVKWPADSSFNFQLQDNTKVELSLIEFNENFNPQINGT